ncbi:hypothetical protein F5884DRAFT_887729 [Xylogone sp. PMI_703]|nr:hypothetical protein F5884DRAFT_887729 [Xylogone sp. PMI_703]
MLKALGEAGKDEIYWTFAAGGDAWDKRSFRTSGFGSIKTGDKRTFPANESLMIDSVVKNCWAVDITCWEADHSNSEWYSNLMKTLRGISDWASRLTTYTGSKITDAFIGLLPGASEYGNDLVKWHSLGWNLESMKMWWGPSGLTDKEFDGVGGGKHALMMRRDSAADNLDQALIPKLTTDRTDQWAGQNTLTKSQIIDGVAVEFISNRIYYSHPNTQQLVWTDDLDTSPTVIEDHLTPLRPAVAVQGNGISRCIAYTGTNNQVYALSSLLNSPWKTTCIAQMPISRLILRPQALSATPALDKLIWWYKTEDLALHRVILTINDLLNRKSVFEAVYFPGYRAASNLSAAVYNDQYCVAYRDSNESRLELLVTDDRGTITTVKYSKAACGDPTLVRDLKTAHLADNK